MEIDIGGGHTPHPGHVNLDQVHGNGVWQRAAQHVPWPVADASVAGIRASHVLEHIPAGTDRITVLNEAHRVLAPGRKLVIWLPLAFVHDQINTSYGPWADPTHVSFWHYPGSFYYLTGVYAPCADYGLRLWEMDETENVLTDWNNAKIVLRKPR